MNNFINKIDYTNLSDTMSNIDIDYLCETATKFGVASICIKPKFVVDAKKILENLNSNMKICTVISFPFGVDHSSKKEIDAIKALKDGANEIDMVLDYNLLFIENNKNYDKNKEYIREYLVEQVSKLKLQCVKYNAILKVIVESGSLTSKEIVFATEICIEANADYIKTSTGMTDVGARLEDIKLMKDVIVKSNSKLKIKASGGIKKIEQLEAFNPYVDRFGMGYVSVNGLVHNVENNIGVY